MGDDLSGWALAVALLSLVMSAAAISWQVAIFLLTGARVRVETLFGLLGPGGLVTWNRPPKDFEVEQARDMGSTAAAIVVKVRNRGREATSVEGVSVAVGGGIQFRQFSGLPNPDLPARLEPHGTLTFMVTAEEVHHAGTVAHSAGVAKRPPTAARGVVELGNGRTVTSKDGFPLWS